MNRLLAPTPKFFKVVRNIGLFCTAIATAIATAPISVPASIVTIATYLGIAGVAAATVAQTAKENE